MKTRKINTLIINSQQHHAPKRVTVDTKVLITQICNNAQLKVFEVFNEKIIENPLTINFVDIPL